MQRLSFSLLVTLTFAALIARPPPAQAVTFTLTAAVTGFAPGLPPNPFGLQVGDPLVWEVTYPDSYLTTNGVVRVFDESALIHIVLGVFAVDFFPSHTGGMLILQDGLPLAVGSESGGFVEPTPAICALYPLSPAQCVGVFIADVITDSRTGPYVNVLYPLPFDAPFILGTDIFGQYTSLTQLSAIPEPATLLLLGSAVGMLFMWRHRWAY